MWFRTSTSTRSIRPTNPMSRCPAASCLPTRNRSPSSPESPTAGCPAWFSRRTMSLFTFPTRTIFATSTVASSETRRPSTNSTGIPSRCMYSVIPGPPPWTTIGFMPTYFSRTTSCEKSSRRPGSDMAAPPYLITIVRPWNSRMYGRASRRVATSLMGDLCRVLRVDGHVLVPEVAEEDLGLAAVPGQGQDVLDLVGPYRLLELAPVGSLELDRRRPRRHHASPLDVKIDV